MKRSNFSFRNENGSTLIVAVLILLLCTTIGIFATNTSTIEIQISGNDKFHKITFYGADSGIYTVPKVISQAINDRATPKLGVISAFTYMDNGTNDDGSTGPTFFRELAGFAPSDNATDIQLVIGEGNQVDVDVERLRVINVVGGGAEFAAASEGAGVGGLKGIFYGLDSFCTGLHNSRSNIGAQYLKVTGAAGGM